MNLLGISRSNALRVREREAFQSAMDALGVECCWNEDGTVIITPVDEATWPSYDEQSEVDITFWQVVAGHLSDGCVGVLQTAAGDSISCFIGLSLAFTNSGQVVSLDLDEIYERAHKAFGISPALCDA